MSTHPAKVSPFFARSPPPPLPMLTAQTPLGISRHASEILANKELPALQPRHQKIQAHGHYSSSTLKSQQTLKSHDGQRIQRTSPAPAGTRSRSVTPDLGGGYESDYPSLYSEEEFPKATTVKMCKPDGEVGRPGDRGYNLKEAMGWDGARYSKLRSIVMQLIESNLDESKPLSDQDPSKLRLVRQQALEKCPELEGFHEEWPVIDMCKIRLKYTASRSRVNEERQAVGDILKSRGKKTKA